MTTFPRALCLLKGAIVGIDIFNPVASVIVFQYNLYKTQWQSCRRLVYEKEIETMKTQLQTQTTLPESAVVIRPHGITAEVG